MEQKEQIMVNTDPKKQIDIADTKELNSLFLSVQKVKLYAASYGKNGIYVTIPKREAKELIKNHGIENTLLETSAGGLLWISTY